jgi:hypothetical protein
VAATAFDRAEAETSVAQGKAEAAVIRARPLAAVPGPAAAVLSQENLRQDRESLRSAAAPIKATPAEQKQQYDDQEDDLKSTHDLSLPSGENQAGFGPKPDPFPFARGCHFTRALFSRLA